MMFWIGIAGVMLIAYVLIRVEEEVNDDRR
jgi:hypothetical protein